MNKLYNMRKYSKNDFSKKELMRIIEKLQNENKKIEKALDKDCKRLESFDAMSYCPPEKHWSKEKWKEWCMKDV